MESMTALSQIPEAVRPPRSNDDLAKGSRRLTPRGRLPDDGVLAKEHKVGNSALTKG
jgi:hypothetical protein